MGSGVLGGGVFFGVGGVLWGSRCGLFFFLGGCKCFFICWGSSGGLYFFFFGA